MQAAVSIVDGVDWSDRAEYFSRTPEMNEQRSQYRPLSTKLSPPKFLLCGVIPPPFLNRHGQQRLVAKIEFSLFIRALSFLRR